MKTTDSYLTRRTIVSTGILAFATQPASPQESTLFSSDVKVVNVLATVRTKSGDIVTGLTKDDFLLAEDNRPQIIKYFSRETDLPLIVGLLIDTSFSQRPVLREEQTASYSFIERVLREGVDKTFLAHFDYRQELLQNLTTSKERLRNALSKVAIADRNGGTALYEAVYVPANDVMGKQSGRKAVIVLTDGLDHGSRVTLDEAIEHAQRADTLIYSILFTGEEPPLHAGYYGAYESSGRQYEDGREVLKKMSAETGGGFFEVSRSMTIDAIYRRIEEELRSQYNIGYSPDRPAENTTFRTIHLKTRRKDLAVQARKGYYSRLDK